MLPRVSRWSLLNEPNQPGWLTPQYERKKRRLVATAAVVYRALATAGIKGLKASGHGRDQILLGETAPIGRTSGSLARRPIPPVEFLRKLFCLNPSGKRLRGAEGRAHGCRKFKRLAVKGFAHHPYQRGGSRPPAEPPQAAGEITISSPSRLRRVLDQAARARSGSRAACRSSTPSSASRPTRPTASSACAWRSSRATSTSPTGWPTATAACARWRSTS